jgi:hypothetical protein
VSDTRHEKLALLMLAALTLIILGIVCVLIIRVGTVDANAVGLLGVIVAGLVAFLTAIVSAVRGYSMSAQLGKVTDQLAASGPVATTDSGDVNVADKT